MSLSRAIFALCISMSSATRFLAIKDVADQGKGHAAHGSKEPQLKKRKPCPSPTTVSRKKGSNDNVSKQSEETILNLHIQSQNNAVGKTTNENRFVLHSDTEQAKSCTIYLPDEFSTTDKIPISSTDCGFDTLHKLFLGSLYISNKSADNDTLEERINKIVLTFEDRVNIECTVHAVNNKIEDDSANPKDRYTCVNESEITNAEVQVAMVSIMIGNTEWARNTLATLKLSLAHGDDETKKCDIVIPAGMKRRAVIDELHNPTTEGCGKEFVSFEDGNISGTLSKMEQGDEGDYTFLTSFEIMFKSTITENQQEKPRTDKLVCVSRYEKDETEGILSKGITGDVKYHCYKGDKMESNYEYEYIGCFKSGDGDEKRHREYKIEVPSESDFNDAGNFCKKNGFKYFGVESLQENKPFKFWCGSAYGFSGSYEKNIGTYMECQEHHAHDGHSVFRTGAVEKYKKDPYSTSEREIIGCPYNNFPDVLESKCQDAGVVLELITESNKKNVALGEGSIEDPTKPHGCLFVNDTVVFNRSRKQKFNVSDDSTIESICEDVDDVANCSKYNNQREKCQNDTNCMYHPPTSKIAMDRGACKNKDNGDYRGMTYTMMSSISDP